MAAEELSESGVADIIRALEAIHSTSSSNDLRKEATQFVESLKDNDAAARNGFLLASRVDHAYVVRYFGLSLLDHALRRLSFDNPGEATNLRSMVLQLAENVRAQDPGYFRNKIPQLWCELAKKTWGMDWTDMDETLQKFWGLDFAHNELVLAVLETLSEDVFWRDDPIRGPELKRGLVQIFTPAAVLDQVMPKNGNTIPVANYRHGQEGWLHRICGFLNECIQNIQTSNTEARDAAVKALKTVRSALSWCIYSGINASHVVPSIFRSLTCRDEQVLLASVEALHQLYGRNDMGCSDTQEIIAFIFDSNYLTILQNLYEWSIVGPDDTDEPKYLISKKLSEMVSYIAGCLEIDLFDSASMTSLEPFFNFMIVIMQHQSLTVSIPVLHLWSKLLTHKQIGNSAFVVAQTPRFLNICTQRLIQWESLSVDSDDPTVQFLLEDIDTTPERHAFVGNYRRYCSSIIETITLKQPQEAINEILGQVDRNLGDLYNGVAPFNMQSFSKSSVPLLRADAQFAVVEAVIKGYSKWVDVHAKAPQESEQERGSLEFAVESWATSLMQRQFEDPVLKQRVIKLVVDISTRALSNNSAYALKVLEHILMTRIPDIEIYPAYSEAVKELHGLASHELRRLAIRYADYFSTFYDLLAPKIQEISLANQVDDKLKMELTSILLIIMQRAINVDPNIRQERLTYFLEPIRVAWDDEQFRNMSSSLEAFCVGLGIENVGTFMQAKRAHLITDWSLVPLDEEGKVVQEQMTRKFQNLPLRGTKTMLAVSTDKLKRPSEAYSIACDMWRDLIPKILPTLLQLLSHAHAFHNPANWAVSNEVRTVVERILTDRFWQAGISDGSREDFYAKITASKATLEGFASSVRGKVRAVRESGYSMLFSMSRLRNQFYGYAELPGPLSEALFKDAEHLSSHQYSVLLNVARCLIDDCPADYRPQFLPPMLSTLFRSLDRKITAEWEIIEQRKNGLVDDNLADEMKSESVLRQLTYSAVIMVASLLDPQRGDPDKAELDRRVYTTGTPDISDSLRNFVLSSPEIFEPLMLFCTHALRMRDTRCCSIITRVIRSILMEFAPPLNTPTIITIREFICSDVLKACITSVHEPYFVDMQKDLAQLIASIWGLYCTASMTPRSIFLTLPGMTEEKVIRTEMQVHTSASPRQQRALVLELLDSLRGVSIAEQGKILGSLDRRKARSALQQRYMVNEMETQQEVARVDINDGPDLSGVADMFG